MDDLWMTYFIHKKVTKTGLFSLGGIRGGNSQLFEVPKYPRRYPGQGSQGRKACSLDYKKEEEKGTNCKTYGIPFMI